MLTDLNGMKFARLYLEGEFMLSNKNLIVLILLSLSCLAFVAFIWRDGTGFSYRKDAREAKKAQETDKDPYILDKDQQAADLQVGQADEVRRPNRLAPDQIHR